MPVNPMLTAFEWSLPSRLPSASLSSASLTKKLFPSLSGAGSPVLEEEGSGGPGGPFSPPCQARWIRSGCTGSAGVAGEPRSPRRGRAGAGVGLLVSARRRHPAPVPVHRRGRMRSPCFRPAVAWLSKDGLLHSCIGIGILVSRKGVLSPNRTGNQVSECGWDEAPRGRFSRS